MNEDKGKDFDHSTEKVDLDEKVKGDAASRARNRTVLLTPEVTGQVRAMLKEEDEKDGGDSFHDPLSDLLPPMGWDKAADAEPSHEEAAAPEEDRKSTAKFRQTGSEPVPAAEPEHAAPSFTVNPQAGLMQNEQPKAVVSQPVAAPKQEPQSRIVAFLISFDNNENGEIFEIRVGRWLLTSRPTEHGDYILIQDESISPLHAIVRATRDGKLQVLDQLSEFGTGVTSSGSDAEEEIAGTMATVEHGDRIRFGKRHFIVCLVPKIDEESGE